MGTEETMTTLPLSNECCDRVRLQLIKTEEAVTSLEKHYAASVRFRASVQRIAAHVAANTRSMGWVAEELAGALSTSWLEDEKLNGKDK